MTKLIVSSKFKRAVRKFTRRNPQLQARIEETIAQIFADSNNPSLGTHKLEGKLAGLLSCSCGYDCRIIFSIESEEDTGEISIVLLNVGTHDEVY
jgi:mRNA interferase YafQ